jgi:hypothetical protein
MRFNETYKLQALEILKTKGKCPSNILCADCLYRKVNKHMGGCNPPNMICTATNYLKAFADELAKEE